MFAVSGEKFTALEVGTFSPRDFLSSGDTGYICDGYKETWHNHPVGDTITMSKTPLCFFRVAGLASVFPIENRPLCGIKLSLGKLKLSDYFFI